MNDNRSQSTWVIWVTLVLALILHAVQLPEPLRWYRPELPLLVLLYWVLALPHRVGVFTAAIVGLWVDLVDGSPLGALAIGSVAAALFVQVIYQRMRQFNLVKQSLIAAALVALALVIENWLQTAVGLPPQGPAYLLSALVSVPFWPVIRRFLRSLRRYYEVN